MKNSITRRVIRPVTFVLLLATVILFVVSFFLINDIISDKTQSYSEAIVTVYSDTVAFDAHNAGVPIDRDFLEEIRFRGDYICRWYEIDFAYIYTIDTATGKLHYIAASGRTDEQKAQAWDSLIGDVRYRDIHPEELAVWNGEQIFGHYTVNNEYGNELCTVLAVEDDFGNRVLAAVDMSVERVSWQVAKTFLITAAFIAVIIIAVDVVVYLILRKRVSDPARKLSRVMNDFITDGKRRDVQLAEDGDDEYAMIATAFNSMTQNIDAYLSDINSLTRVQQKQQTELEIAAKIQKGFLPPEKHAALGYKISAMMQPARNVGGDFYDYLRLDDHRVLVVIADVSGKGVSAALFMAVTLVLIRQFARMNLSPAEILRRTNDSLSVNNAEMLFATAFVGIYDRNTGCFTYSNAGHNHPYLLSDRVHCIDDATGALVGLFEKEIYPEATLHLNRGDSVFLFTDGVNESTNAERQFFGDDRLEKVLADVCASHSGDSVSAVLEAVKRFKGDSEQHDDITMLSLSACDSLEMSLGYDIREFFHIKEAILDLPMPRQKQLNLCLAAEECFVNICSYAFPDGVPDGEKIHFVLSMTDRVTLRLEDGGQPFDPLANMKTPDDYDIDTQIGGLGDFLAMSIADDIRYDYRDSKNILTFTMFLEEQNHEDHNSKE